MIEIKSRTAQKWLHCLGFKYKDVKKNIFVDGHKQLDVVKDRKRFLKKIEKLKPYLVEFNEDGTMKKKNYSTNYAIGGFDCQSVKVITYDEYIFSANNGICKA